MNLHQEAIQPLPRWNCLGSVQIQDFFQGAGGPGQKTVRTTFFLVLNLFTVYRGGPIFLLQRKLYFSKDPEGVQHFPGGPTFFFGGGGVQ